LKAVPNSPANNLELPRRQISTKRWEHFSLSALDRGGGVKWGVVASRASTRGEVLHPTIHLELDKTAEAAQFTSNGKAIMHQP
jgi:hypothetical protein